jgi:hypothetical protein
MANETGFAARGKVTKVEGDVVTFLPSNTTYEFHLKAAGGNYAGPTGVLVEGVIRCQARKIWTVPSGGSWVTPIFGPPKIVQGRVKAVNDDSIVVQAGCLFVIKLPAEDTSFDLINGGIGVGTMVNATVMPGATFELVTQEAAAAAP